MPKPQEKPVFLLLRFTEGGSPVARQTGTGLTLQKCLAWSPHIVCIYCSQIVELNPLPGAVF